MFVDNGNFTQSIQNRDASVCWFFTVFLLLIVELKGGLSDGEEGLVLQCYY